MNAGQAKSLIGGEQRLRSGPRSPTPVTCCLAPVISEKCYGLIEEGPYTFLVHPDSNKTQIKIAVEKVFGVTVTGVNTRQPPGQAQADPWRIRQAARTPSGRS